MAEIRRLDAPDPGFDAALAKLTALRRGAGRRDRRLGRQHHRRRARARRRRGARIHGAVRPGQGDVGRARWSCRAAELEARARHAARRPEAMRLRRPRERIRAYHERQRAESWSFTEADGTRLGQRVTPLERVGVYVPGGKAAYPSSVLMNAMPAKVAGVGRDRHGRADAQRRAKRAGARRRAPRRRRPRTYAIGGAQAIAALAYGTATIAAGGQDRRAGQRLRRRGQAARVRRGRHRHGRRARPRCW